MAHHARPTPLQDEYKAALFPKVRPLTLTTHFGQVLPPCQAETETGEMGGAQFARIFRACVDTPVLRFSCESSRGDGGQLGFTCEINYRSSIVVGIFVNLISTQEITFFFSVRFFK